MRSKFESFFFELRFVVSPEYIFNSTLVAVFTCEGISKPNVLWIHFRSTNHGLYINRILRRFELTCIIYGGIISPALMASAFRLSKN